MKAVAGQFDKGDQVRFVRDPEFNPQFDVATVVGKGPEVSEIKWADGRSRYIPNEAMIRWAPGARQKTQEGPTAPPVKRRGRPRKTAPEPSGRPAKPRGKRK